MAGTAAHTDLGPLVATTLIAGLGLFAGVGHELRRGPALGAGRECALRPEVGLGQALVLPGARLVAGRAELNETLGVVLRVTEVLVGAPLPGSLPLVLDAAPNSGWIGRPRLWVLVSGPGHQDPWLWSFPDEAAARQYVAEVVASAGPSAPLDRERWLTAIQAAWRARTLELRVSAALDLGAALGPDAASSALGEAQALELLSELAGLQPQDPALRLALRALAPRLPNSRAVGTALLERLATAGPGLIPVLAEGFEQGRAPGGAVLEAFADGVVEGRPGAAELLGRLGGPEAQRVLWRYLEGEDPRRQAAAFLAFAGQGDPTVTAAAQAVLRGNLASEPLKGPQTELERLLARRALDQLRAGPGAEQLRLMAAGYYLLRIPGGVAEAEWLTTRLQRLNDSAVAAFLRQRAEARWQSFDAPW